MLDTWITNARSESQWDINWHAIAVPTVTLKHVLLNVSILYTDTRGQPVSI
jgi:hypothetical protein